MAPRTTRRRKAAVKVEDTGAFPVPADLLSFILLRTTPRTLWSARLVCKPWYALITSPEFVAARRRATGGAWLVSFRYRRRNDPVLRASMPWIKIYNPLLNVEEKVPNPRANLEVCGAYGECLLLDLFNPLQTWNPVSGTIKSRWKSRFDWPFLDNPEREPPECEWGVPWSLCVYSRGYEDMMAISAARLAIFRWLGGQWELAGAMPDDMQRVMGEKGLRFVATPNYYLIWTAHTMQEREKVVLFRPAERSWTWVDNTCHSRSSSCRWKEDKPLVLFCF